MRNLHEIINHVNKEFDKVTEKAESLIDMIEFKQSLQEIISSRTTNTERK